MTMERQHHLPIKTLAPGETNDTPSPILLFDLAPGCEEWDITEAYFTIKPLLAKRHTHMILTIGVPIPQEDVTEERPTIQLGKETILPIYTFTLKRLNKSIVAIDEEEYPRIVSQVIRKAGKLNYHAYIAQLPRITQRERTLIEPRDTHIHEPSNARLTPSPRRVPSPERIRRATKRSSKHDKEKVKGKKTEPFTYRGQSLQEMKLVKRRSIYKKIGLSTIEKRILTYVLKSIDYRSIQKRTKIPRGSINWHLNKIREKLAS